MKEEVYYENYNKNVNNKETKITKKQIMIELISNGSTKKPNEIDNRIIIINYNQYVRRIILFGYLISISYDIKDEIILKLENNNYNCYC